MSYAALTLTLTPGKFLIIMLLFFCCLLIFFSLKSNFFEKLFQEHHLGVKQIGSRSGLIFVSGLMWVQTVSKDYQQMTLGGKELSMEAQEGSDIT